jgi:CheY-like chemotaxis protein
MGIQGNVSLLEAEIDPHHPHQARLRTVEELVRGGAKLTAQLLGYARAGRYEIQTFDLNPLVRQTVETFGLARKEVRVRQALSAAQLPVRGDRGQIEQVLLNLFVNAAEAMPGGGGLYVSTEVSYQEAPDDRTHGHEPAVYARIEVRDTGTGMDGDTIRRIFDPFFTTKGMSGGSGLGLTSSYGTVKAHGGYIEVSSELGVGSTFAICLPLTDRKAEAPVEQLGEPVAGQGQVLVVDDDEAVLEACGAILELLDYSTIRAASGRRALEVYREHGDEIDLVVLDMILPDISGGEVYDGLRAIDPKVRVLLASGYSIDGEAQKILGRGCDDFIQKPFTIEQLSRKVAGLLARR